MDSKRMREFGIMKIYHEMDDFLREYKAWEEVYPDDPSTSPNSLGIEKCL